MGQDFNCNTCKTLVVLNYDIAWEDVRDMYCYDCAKEHKMIADFIWFTPFEIEELGS
jgi:hypothetical protein